MTPRQAPLQPAVPGGLTIAHFSQTNTQQEHFRNYTQIFSRYLRHTCGRFLNPGMTTPVLPKNPCPHATFFPRSNFNCSRPLVSASWPTQWTIELLPRALCACWQLVIGHCLSISIGAASIGTHSDSLPSPRGSHGESQKTMERNSIAFLSLHDALFVLGAILRQWKKELATRRCGKIQPLIAFVTQRPGSSARQRHCLDRLMWFLSGGGIADPLPHATAISEEGLVAGQRRRSWPERKGPTVGVCEGALSCTRSGRSSPRLVRRLS